MKVEPVGFGAEHKQLLYHVKFLLGNKYLQIHPTINKLVIAPRSAWDKDNVLDKEVTSHKEVLDAFHLAPRPFKEQPIME